MNLCWFLNSRSPKEAVTETRNLMIKIFMSIFWVVVSELLGHSSSYRLCGIPIRHIAQDIHDFLFLLEFFTHVTILYVLGVCTQVLQAVKKQKTEKCDFPRCRSTGIPNNKKKEGKGTVENEIPWLQTLLYSNWRIQGICTCSVVRYLDRRIYIRGACAAEMSSHVLQKSLQCKI